MEIVGQTELIGNIQEKLKFLHKARIINPSNTEMLKAFFHKNINPKIVVTDVEGIIGAFN